MTPSIYLDYEFKAHYRGEDILVKRVLECRKTFGKGRGVPLIEWWKKGAEIDVELNSGGYLRLILPAGYCDYWIKDPNYKRTSHNSPAIWLDSVASPSQQKLIVSSKDPEYKHFDSDFESVDTLSRSRTVEKSINVREYMHFTPGEGGESEDALVYAVQYARVHQLHTEIQEVQKLIKSKCIRDKIEIFPIKFNDETSMRSIRSKGNLIGFIDLNGEYISNNKEMHFNVIKITTNKYNKQFHSKYKYRYYYGGVHRNYENEDSYVNCDEKSVIWIDGVDQMMLGEVQ